METLPLAMDTSDTAVLALLKRIKASNDENEIRQLSDLLERIIFHQEAGPEALAASGSSVSGMAVEGDEVQ